MHNERIDERAAQPKNAWMHGANEREKRISERASERAKARRERANEDANERTSDREPKQATAPNGARQRRGRTGRAGKRAARKRLSRGLTRAAGIRMYQTVSRRAAPRRLGNADPSNIHCRQNLPGANCFWLRNMADHLALVFWAWVGLVHRN